MKNNSAIAPDWCPLRQEEFNHDKYLDQNLLWGPIS